MRQPNLFIVGAPKCGTTAMDDYLKKHPEIFMAPVKELHYFGSDLILSKPRLTLREYLSYFRESSGETFIGESSVLYLYSKLAALEIKEFSPLAKIIIMLRNPVDMIYSLHNQVLYTDDEDITDFEMALAAEEDRKKGKRIPAFMSSPKQVLYYKELARYSSQVQRYFDVFGKENVFIILFDKFIKNTEEVYRDTLQFLGVTDLNYLPELKKINSNKKIGSRRLKHALNRPPDIIRSVARRLVPARIRTQILNRLANLNTFHTSRLPMKPELKRRLREDFLSEIEELSKIIRQDLSFWLK